MSKNIGPKKKKGALGFAIGAFAAVGAAIFLSKKENRTKVVRVAKSTAKKARTVARKARTAAKKAKTAAKRKVTKKIVKKKK